MKEINLGNMEEMGHWSKTSSVEPLPVGRHKKLKKDVECGFRFNGDYPVVRASHGVFTRPIDHRGCGGESKIRVDNVQSPKFVRKMISTPQDANNVEDRKGKSCLNPNPFPEQEGTTVKSRILHESNDDKNEKRVTLKNEKAPFSSTSTLGQRTEHQDKWIRARKKVKAMLYEFRAYCDSLLEKDKKKREFRRIDIVAANLIKEKYGYSGKAFLGSIPGVEVGDRFNYRMELHVLGVHRPPQWGIDFMDNDGRKIAISVVDSGGYDNYMSNQDTLIYCGQGGNSRANGGQGCPAEDQKLKKGNLALMNSIKEKNPVRVIKGSKVLSTLTFFYDGLYTVEKMWEDINLGGKLIKFKLVRMPGQPSRLPRRSI